MAASEATKDAVYLRDFLAELGFPDPHPTKLHVDNSAARDLAYNPEHHARTKHIDRRHFYVREVVEELRIVVPYVPTDQNVADFFTKALPADKFLKFRQAVMNLEPYSQAPTSGGRTLSAPGLECGGVSCGGVHSPTCELNDSGTTVPTVPYAPGHMPGPKGAN